jgi:hypothetical protein
MSLNEELKNIIRDLKYRTQELHSQTLRARSISDFKSKISEIRALIDRLESEIK